MTPLRRRLILNETALVLAVSLGQAAVYSVLRIIDRLTRPVPLAQQTSSLNNAVTPDRPWLDLGYQIVNTGFIVVPALLALYLLATRFVPVGGVQQGLGFRPGRPWGDLARGLGLAALIGIPGLGLYLGARALGANTTVQAANLGAHWWTVPILVVAAAMNGILEEVVMVGYLITRWAQAGVRRWLAVGVSALIRGSYHLYQGFGGFVGNVIMGVIFGLVFVRTRRLWPLIVAHTVLDIVSFVGYAALTGRVSWL